MKNNLLEPGETVDKILMGEKYSRTEQQNTFIRRSGISNGNALATTQDAHGKRTLTRAFAGSITEPPAQFSNTVEYNPKEEWSNGSDTRDIEKKLRATKKELGYIEVKTHQHGGKRTGAGRPRI